MPSLRNIWTNPDALLLSDMPTESPGIRRAEVRIRGLLCYLCSVRVTLFYEALPWVKDITFHPEEDRFTLLYEGGESRFPELRAAVNAAVIGRGARIWLEEVGRGRQAPSEAGLTCPLDPP